MIKGSGGSDVTTNLLEPSIKVSPDVLVASNLQNVTNSFQHPELESLQYETLFRGDCYDAQNLGNINLSSVIRKDMDTISKITDLQFHDIPQQCTSLCKPDTKNNIKLQLNNEDNKQPKHIYNFDDLIKDFVIDVGQLEDCNSESCSDTKDFVIEDLKQTEIRDDAEEILQTGTTITANVCDDYNSDINDNFDENSLILFQHETDRLDDINSFNINLYRNQYQYDLTQGSPKSFVANLKTINKYLNTNLKYDDMSSEDEMDIRRLRQEMPCLGFEPGKASDVPDTKADSLVDDTPQKRNNTKVGLKTSMLLPTCEYPERSGQYHANDYRGYSNKLKSGQLESYTLGTEVFAEKETTPCKNKNSVITFPSEVIQNSSKKNLVNFSITEPSSYTDSTDCIAVSTESRNSEQSQNTIKTHRLNSSLVTCPGNMHYNSAMNYNSTAPNTLSSPSVYEVSKISQTPQENPPISVKKCATSREPMLRLILKSKNSKEDGEKIGLGAPLEPQVQIRLKRVKLKAPTIRGDRKTALAFGRPKAGNQLYEQSVGISSNVPGLKNEEPLIVSTLDELSWLASNACESDEAEPQFVGVMDPLSMTVQSSTSELDASDMMLNQAYESDSGRDVTKTSVSQSHYKRPSCRSRASYSMEQLKIMQRRFERSHYISKRELPELAAISRISKNQVKMWFQNRRAKLKKLSRKASFLHFCKMKETSIGVSFSSDNRRAEKRRKSSAEKVEKLGSTTPPKTLCPKIISQTQRNLWNNTFTPSTVQHNSNKSGNSANLSGNHNHKVGQFIDDKNCFRLDMSSEVIPLSCLGNRRGMSLKANRSVSLAPIQQNSNENRQNFEGRTIKSSRSNQAVKAVTYYTKLKGYETNLPSQLPVCNEKINPYRTVLSIFPKNKLEGQSENAKKSSRCTSHSRNSMTAQGGISQKQSANSAATTHCLSATTCSLKSTSSTSVLPCHGRCPAQHVQFQSEVTMTLSCGSQSSLNTVASSCVKNNKRVQYVPVDNLQNMSPLNRPVRNSNNSNVESISVSDCASVYVPNVESYPQKSVFQNLTASSSERYVPPKPIKEPPNLGNNPTQEPLEIVNAGSCTTGKVIGFEHSGGLEPNNGNTVTEPDGKTCFSTLSVPFSNISYSPPHYLIQNTPVQSSEDACRISGANCFENTSQVGQSDGCNYESKMTDIPNLENTFKQPLNINYTSNTFKNNLLSNKRNGECCDKSFYKQDQIIQSNEDRLLNSENSSQNAACTDPQRLISEAYKNIMNISKQFLDDNDQMLDPIMYLSPFEF